MNLVPPLLASIHNTLSLSKSKMELEGAVTAKFESDELESEWRAKFDQMKRIHKEKFQNLSRECADMRRQCEELEKREKLRLQEPPTASSSSFSPPRRPTRTTPCGSVEPSSLHYSAARKTDPAPKPQIHASPQANVADSRVKPSEVPRVPQTRSSLLRKQQVQRKSELEQAKALKSYPSRASMRKSTERSKLAPQCSAAERDSYCRRSSRVGMGQESVTSGVPTYLNLGPDEGRTQTPRAKSTQRESGHSGASASQKPPRSWEATFPDKIPRRKGTGPDTAAKSSKRDRSPHATPPKVREPRSRDASPTSVKVTMPRVPVRVKNRDDCTWYSVFSRRESSASSGSSARTPRLTLLTSSKSAQQAPLRTGDNQDNVRSGPALSGLFNAETQLSCEAKTATLAASPRFGAGSDAGSPSVDPSLARRPKRKTPKRGCIPWNPYDQPCLRAVASSQKAPKARAPRRPERSIRDTAPWGGVYHDPNEWKKANGATISLDHTNLQAASDEGYDEHSRTDSPDVRWGCETRQSDDEWSPTVNASFNRGTQGCNGSPHMAGQASCPSVPWDICNAPHEAWHDDRSSAGFPSGDAQDWSEYSQGMVRSDSWQSHTHTRRSSPVRDWQREDDRIHSGPSPLTPPSRPLSPARQISPHVGSSASLHRSPTNDVAAVRRMHREHFQRDAAAAKELRVTLQSLQRMCPGGVRHFADSFDALEESFQIRLEALNRAMAAAEKRIGDDRTGPRVQRAVEHCLHQVSKVALKLYESSKELIDMMREREELKQRGFSQEYSRMEELTFLILESTESLKCDGRELAPHWRGVPYEEIIMLDRYRG